MNKNVLLVASGSWQPGLMFSYRRAFESYGFRVEQFDLDARRRAAIAVPSMMRSALDPLVGRVLGYLDLAPVDHKADRALVSAARELAPAIVIVSCHEPIRAATLVQLKISLPAAKVVSIFPDTLFNMRESLVSGLPVYDLFCTHTRAGIPYLERLGCRSPLYVPLAADPTLHHPFPLSPAEARDLGCEVVYVGNWRRDHEALFARLRAFDLAIYGGPLWAKAQDPWVRSRWRGHSLDTGEAYAKAHIAAKVCLNPIDPFNLPGHNQRVFELPACGVFSLVTRSEDVTTIFREGETVACFDSPDEMVAQIRSYLGRPEDRRRIAAAAHDLVLRGGHTYRDRVRSIVEALGMAALLG
jgi:spore maturation protein CgeB